MSETRWHQVPETDVPDEGRVGSTVLDGRSVALTRCGGTLGALENRCPHQGGPVGEGSIENGWLRCPWHGYDYDPLSGKPPEGFSDAVAAYDVDERADGVFVSLPDQVPHQRSVSDVLVETLVAHGVNTVFGMIGHSWAEYAELCGATGIRVDHRDQLDEALRRLFATDGPALLCVQQDAALL